MKRCYVQNVSHRSISKKWMIFICTIGWRFKRGQVYPRICRSTAGYVYGGS